MHIAIITARGGSKRLPRKNILPFHGKPLIAWPIEAALASKCFEHVFVSTEDKEIASIAQSYGATVPYLRPSVLADDITHAHVAAKEMLEWAIQQYGNISAFCHIYPTAVFLTSQIIQQGEKAICNGAPNAYAVQRAPFPIYQAMVYDNGGLRHLFDKEKYAMRSQDMPIGYYGVGQMYWFRTSYFLEFETDICSDTAPIEIPRERCVDIDTVADLQYARKIAVLLDLLERGE